MLAIHDIPHNLLAFEKAVAHIVDEGRTVHVILIDDFAKGFDSASHRFLLAKSFGLGDVLIEACLSGRILRVHAGEELSGTIPMPQGSVIGPLSFLLS